MSIHSIKSLPAMLIANGISVPRALSDAVKAANWSTVPGSTFVAEARVAVDQAKDAKSFIENLSRYSTLKAEADLVKSTQVQEVAAQSIASRLYAQVAPLAEMLPTVIDKFNDDAPAFVAAAMALPNLDGVGAMDVTPDVAQALTGAKDAASVLHRRFDLFCALTRLLGYDSPSGTGREDALSTLLYLCEPTESTVQAGFGVATSAVWLATDQINAYRNGDSRLKLGPLAPYIVPVTFEWDLKLVSPDEADNRRRRVFGQ